VAAAAQQLWYVKFLLVDKLHKIEQIVAHHASNLASETVVSHLWVVATHGLPEPYYYP